MDLNTQKITNVKVDKTSAFLKLFRMITPKKVVAATGLSDYISDSELLESIKSAKKEWLDANMNFEYVEDKDIVDYYTYKILACQIRYEYFLKKAKEKGFKGEILARES